MSASLGTRSDAQEADASVYVYYRVRVTQADAILEALGRHREILHRTEGPACPRPLVQRRPSSDLDFETWLERYDGIDPESLALVRARISQAAHESGLTALATEGRREESFRGVACA